MGALSSEQGAPCLREKKSLPEQYWGALDKEEEYRKIKTHEDLIIYQKAFQAAMTIFGD